MAIALWFSSLCWGASFSRPIHRFNSLYKSMVLGVMDCLSHFTLESSKKESINCLDVLRGIFFLLLSLRVCGAGVEVSEGLEGFFRFDAFLGFE